MASGGCSKSSPNTLETMVQLFLRRKSKAAPTYMAAQQDPCPGRGVFAFGNSPVKRCFLFTLSGLSMTVHRRLCGFLPVLYSTEASAYLLCNSPKAKLAKMDGSGTVLGAAVLGGFQPFLPPPPRASEQELPGTGLIAVFLQTSAAGACVFQRMLPYPHSPFTETP